MLLAVLSEIIEGRLSILIMKANRLIPITACWLLLNACHREPPRSMLPPPAAATSTPTSGPPTTPAALAAALERRWPLENIARFCSPERRWWPGCQNLVASPMCTDSQEKGEVWKGDLFKGAETGFDRIWWYATVCGNRIQAYSLNAKRGEDNWGIEIGTLDTLTVQPQVEPSAKSLCFEGGDHSRYQ